MIKIRAVMDQHSPAIDQATLARFLTEGFFSLHQTDAKIIFGPKGLLYRTIEQIVRQ